MNLKKLSKNFFLALTIIVFSSNFIIFPVNAGNLEDQLSEYEKQLAAIQAEKDKIQTQIDANNYLIAGYNSQLSKLYGEAQIYQKDIEEVGIQIEQLNLQIKKMDEDIEDKKAEIVESEKSIAVLEKESQERIKESYMSFRMNSGKSDAGSNVIFSNNINQYFKTSQYKEIMQSDTNNFLVDLLTLKTELDDDKAELEQKLIDVRKDKELVDIKAQDLNNKKSELDAKMSFYYIEAAKVNNQSGGYQNTLAVFSQQEAETRAQAEYVKQQILNNFTSIPNGQYVIAGTMVGRQGSTGWSTGPHLHFSVYYNGTVQNPCAYLKSGAMQCGFGDMLDAPLSGSMVFTSGFGDRCFWWNGQNTCQFHDGIDVAGIPWNTIVYAAHDGYISKGVDYYGANYVVICQNTNCNNGLKTGYWHLSEF